MSLSFQGSQDGPLLQTTQIMFTEGKQVAGRKQHKLCLLQQNCTGLCCYWCHPCIDLVEKQ